MHAWIALLRGINVGGANRLSMAELRDRLSVPATARNWRTVTRVWEIVVAQRPGG